MKGHAKVISINGIKINPGKLLSKGELLSFLRENGEDDRALSIIRDQQYEEIGNELIWRYPISDGNHLGTYIVAVKEGFISLPYDAVDKYDGELLELNDSNMFDADAMQIFIDDWRLWADDLVGAMTDMLAILRSR